MKLVWEKQDKVLKLKFNFDLYIYLFDEYISFKLVNIIIV